MDISLANAIISAASVLVGTVTGASVTLLTGRQQRKAANAKDQRDRMHEAAQDCDRLLIDLDQAARALPYKWRGRDRVVSEEESKQCRQSADQLQALQRELQMKVMYLPHQFRECMQLLGRILRYAQWMAYEYDEIHPDSEQRIIQEVCAYGRTVVANLVSLEPVPELPERLMHYRAALVDVDEQRQEEVGSELADEENAINVFISRHPELRDELDTRKK